MPVVLSLHIWRSWGNGGSRLIEYTGMNTAMSKCLAVCMSLRISLPFFHRMSKRLLPVLKRLAIIKRPFKILKNASQKLFLLVIFLFIVFFLQRSVLWYTILLLGSCYIFLGSVQTVWPGRSSRNAHQWSENHQCQVQIRGKILNHKRTVFWAGK